jgi:hypothetical protein
MPTRQDENDSSRDQRLIAEVSCTPESTLSLSAAIGRLSREVLTARKLKIPAIPISKMLLSKRCLPAIANWTTARILPSTADMRISTNEPEKATREAVPEATAAVKTKTATGYGIV